MLVSQKETEATILEIFVTGSRVFLERNTDQDFVAICRNYKQRRTRRSFERGGIVYDIVIIDETAVSASFDFSDLFYVPKEIKFFNYMFDKNIRKTVYGGVELNWSMLDHKQEYLAFIKDRFNNKSNLGILKDPWRMGKSFVHYYTILKIYENNKVEITEEMLNNITLLYGGTEEAKPVIDWVFAKMNEL